MILSNLSEEELYVCNRALEEYRKNKIRQLRNYQIMKEKKFNYGDTVAKKKSSYFDGVFDIVNDEVGIIVGHYECRGIEQHGRDMYRVYYDSNNSYIGEDVNSIERYEGKIPEHLSNVEWNQIWEINVRLK